MQPTIDTGSEVRESVTISNATDVAAAAALEEQPDERQLLMPGKLAERS
jgi:hypothetical protein